MADALFQPSYCPLPTVALENALQERAKMQYSEPSVQEMAGATKVAVKRLRTALGAAGVLSTAARLRRARPRALESVDADASGA